MNLRLGAEVTKVFISYAWESEEHRAWVKALADRLLADGIEAIVDQYDLELGDRLPQFMEQSVRSSDYVLIVCTPVYKQKADARIGGVGYEGHIISGELFSGHNERKFIPVIKEGGVGESLPTFLKGKLAVDLGDGVESRGYDDLLATLYGAKKKPSVAPKRRIPQTFSEKQQEDGEFEPVRIIGIVVDEVGEPRNDGTRGSALYKVPFKLSRHPSPLWIELFVRTWSCPPRFTSMHRPGIASVVGDEIVLNGTTIEEVRDYHRDTLILCVKEANRLEAEYLEREQKRRAREETSRAAYRKNVENVAGTIDF